MGDNIFSRKAYDHLSKYKTDTLGIGDDGVYKKNNKSYSHILPERFNNKNILPSEYYEQIIEKISKVKLHKDFHHLNSSQAMCFNLFYPIAIENSFNHLAGILDVRFDAIPDAYFEYIDPEEKNEKTNFDFYLEDNTNRFYFEVKYTEANFASQKDDESHIKKYKNIYHERLKIFKSVGINDFFKNYQLFRNLIYLNKGFVIFIIPGRRDDLKNRIKQICDQYLTDEQKNKVRIVDIEKIADALISTDEKMKDHYRKFREKYIFWDIEKVNR